MKRRNLLIMSVALALTATPVLLANEIKIEESGTGTVIQNKPDYSSGEDPTIVFSLDPLPSLTPSLIGTAGPNTEEGGFYVDGDTAVIFNPGDGAFFPSLPPSALLYLIDSDDWVDGDGDPYDNGAIVAYLNLTGVWQTSSRARKSNLARLAGGMEAVRRLSGYSYEFLPSEAEMAKGDTAPQPAMGVLAEEVQAVLPSAVASNDDGEMWVNYSQLTPVLIEAIKELEARIAVLEAKAGRR